MKILDSDSPLMSGLNKFADLIWVNILTLLCCLPLITAGASFTAMHYMCLKISRDEECYITKDFFKSFRTNFRQSTIIWFFELLIIIFLICDFWIVYRSGYEFPMIVYVAIILVAAIVTLGSTFIFPVLAKFDNSILKTVKNGILISLVQFPKAVLYLLLNILMIGVMYFFIQILPLYLFFGLSYPAFAFAKLYDKFFEKLETRILEENKPAETEEDERIFKDEPLL